MKKILIGLAICLISLIITFTTFEMLSWYHFGDNPTKSVLIRLIIFFIVLVTIITGIVILLKKHKK